MTGDLATGDKVNVFQGDDVFRNEGVRTDADSSARLVLRDNTNLLLGPSSAIKLDRFVYAGPSQPGAIAVNLVKGALRFATGDADKTRIYAACDALGGPTSPGPGCRNWGGEDVKDFVICNPKKLTNEQGYCS